MKDAQAKAKRWAILLFVVSTLMLATLACGGGEPQQVEVVKEVTRIVPETVEVEVTQVVPQTVEVTRIVQVVVTATSPPPTRTPRPTATPEAPEVGSRANPVPFSEPFGLVMGQTKQFTLSVTRAHRGDEAWSRILEANQFNDPPLEGMEYILLYVEVDYTEGPADEPLQLDTYDFDVVSKGQVIESVSVVEPDPEFSISFFPAAARGGWFAWPCFVDAPGPLLVIGMDLLGRRGFYFAPPPSLTFPCHCADALGGTSA